MHDTANTGFERTTAKDKPAITVWMVRLRGALALLLVLVFAFYGFLAIEESWSARKFMPSENRTNMLALREATDAGADVLHNGQIEAAGMPLWFRLMAERTRAGYSYGSDSVFDTLVYYTEMPAFNKVTLSFHMLLGGLCMVLGGSQFWPAFRRRFPKLHRVFGMVFVVTAQSAMVMSFVYLWRTTADNTYGGLTFHVGLWFLAIGVTIALWLAMYHVWRREIAQHQAWMGIAYGFLLTAPLLRYDWTLLGMIFPNVAMNEANYAGMMLLIPQCFLFGYGLVCVNRWLSCERTTPQALPFGDTARAALPRWWPVVSLLCLVLAGLTLYHYLIAPGLAGSVLAQQMIPASVIANDSRVFGTVTVASASFAVLVSGALLLAPLFLRNAFRLAPGAALTPVLRRQGLALAAIAAMASLLALHFAGAVGAPSHATLSGGATYFLMGVAGLVFSLLLAQAAWRERLALVKEWGVFVVLIVATAPLFYVMLAVLSLFDLSAPHLAAGHGYMLAAGFAPGLLLVGFIYAIYGSATRERVAY